MYLNWSQSDLNVSLLTIYLSPIPSDILRESGENPVQNVTPGAITVKSILKDVKQKHLTAKQERGRALKVSITEAAVTQATQKAELIPAGRCETSERALPVQETSGSQNGPAQPSSTLLHFPVKNSNDCYSSGAASRPPQPDLDPLATFIMLRSKQVSRTTAAPQNSRAKNQNQTEPKKDVNSWCAGSVDTGGSEGLTETKDQATSSSLVIEVQASESQCQAYSQLSALATAFLSSPEEPGTSAAACGSFATLTSDQTRFSLKQQEKELSSGLKQDCGPRNVFLWTFLPV
ncbi:protein shortage in chiasmata 1 ortholog-like [Amia ocellicauda]|uniref:protein shortage in chiasmata 1 ortholog-like n=1 Tax=Amia ocellicauda TaxID=2972642 RepID=UPI0034640B02